MYDTYEKRDRLSHYKKMNLNTLITDSSIPNQSEGRELGSSLEGDSPDNGVIQSLKMSKTGMPIAPANNNNNKGQNQNQQQQQQN